MAALVYVADDVLDDVNLKPLSNNTDTPNHFRLAILHQLRCGPEMLKHSTYVYKV